MTLQELRDQVASESADIRVVLQELDEVRREAEGGPITSAIRNGGAALIAQCYTGIENILKRVAKYSSRSLPRGSDWHAELPTLFSVRSGGFIGEKLLEHLALMRRFRHVVHHGYGFKLHWESVQVAMNESRQTVEDVDAHLQSLDGQAGR